MRKLLHELFYIPKYGKMKESAFLSRIVGSVTLIVLYLAAISFAAFAYFSSSVTSGINTIKAASYDLKIWINDEELEKTVTLPAGTYTVTLTIDSETTASTGFCIVKIGDVTYYTAQIGADLSAERGKRDAVSFTLTVTGNDVTVEFTPCWGTSSAYAGSISETEEEFFITEGKTLEIQTGELSPEENKDSENSLPGEDDAQTAPPREDDTIDEPVIDDTPNDDPENDSTDDDILDNPQPDNIADDTQDGESSEDTTEDETQSGDGSEDITEDETQFGDSSEDTTEDDTQFGDSSEDTTEDETQSGDGSENTTEDKTQFGEGADSDIADGTLNGENTDNTTGVTQDSE